MMIYESGATQLSIKLRFSIDPLIPTTSGILGKTPPLAPTLPLTLFKRIHHATHASAKETIRICKSAGWINGDFMNVIEQIFKQYEESPNSGSPCRLKRYPLRTLFKPLMTNYKQTLHTSKSVKIITLATLHGHG